MSKYDNLADGNFTFVRTRKRHKKSKVNITCEFPQIQQEEYPDFDKAAALRRIKAAKEEISISDVFCSVTASLREGLESLKNPEIKEIVCLGLGHIGERLVSRYQLALLLCLKTHLCATVYVQDPVFCTAERELLQDLGCTVLEENIEGKYKAKTDFATVYYLPHCPKQLTNNLLWSNWNLNLSNCILIANSFCDVIDAFPKRYLAKNASFISEISPYVIELAVINTFKFYEVFNDTAIHVFPSSRLTLIPADFWNNRDEPKYDSDAVEIITSKFVNINL